MSQHQQERRQGAPPVTTSPGPWQVQPRQNDHGDTTVIVARDGFVVATIPSRAWDDKARLSDPQDRLNAKLLAEAPNLRDRLAALVRCLAWHVEGQGRGVAMDAEELRQARALLAALEGAAT